MGCRGEQYFEEGRALLIQLHLVEKLLAQKKFLNLGVFF